MDLLAHHLPPVFWGPDKSCTVTTSIVAPPVSCMCRNHSPSGPNLRAETMNDTLNPFNRIIVEKFQRQSFFISCVSWILSRALCHLGLCPTAATADKRLDLSIPYLRVSSGVFLLYFLRHRPPTRVVNRGNSWKYLDFFIPKG